MYNSLEDPVISRAMRTGYGYEWDEPIEYELEQDFFYSPECGEMDKEEAIAFMVEYVRSNFLDAAEMFGLEWRKRSVPCDAYGELL